MKIRKSQYTKQLYYLVQYLVFYEAKVWKCNVIMSGDF